MMEIREKFESIAVANAIGETKKKFSDLRTKYTRLAIDSMERAVSCPEKVVAIIESSSAKIIYNEELFDPKIRESKDIFDSKLDTIALVLESPHTKEFCKGRAIAPAMGETGTNIKKCLLGNLAKFTTINDLEENGAYFKSSSPIVEGKYNLLLINAVQYQCSLGNLSGNANKVTRDRIFHDCFADEVFQNDFIVRLKKYSPKIILNCCTAGIVDGITLQNQVQEIIDKNFPAAIKMRGAHPSSPWFAKGFR